MRAILALVETWLLLDFFGEGRRSGKSSSLTTVVFGQAFVVLVFAALLFPDVPLCAYAAANLSLSTTFAALGALAEPKRAERRRADLVLVATAPLPRSAQAIATALHASVALVLTTLGNAIPPAVLCLWLTDEPVLVVPLYLVLAVACAALATGAIAVLGRILARLLSPEAEELTLATLKALLMGALFLGFALCLPKLSKSAAELPLGPASAWFWPPWWCGRILAGTGVAWPFVGLLLGSGAALLLAGLAIPEPPVRRVRARKGRPGPLDRMLAGLARTRELRGAARFCATMLLRSPGYRAKVLPLFGMPAAMLCLASFGLEGTARPIWLGMVAMLPAIYLPFLVHFLPRTDQPEAAWILTTSPTDLQQLGVRAAAVALTTHVLVPVHALALAGMLLSGVRVVEATNLSLLALAVAVLHARLATRRMQAPPFTEPDEEASGFDAGAALGLSLVLGGIGAAFGMVAGSALALLVTCPLLGLSLGRLYADGRF